MPRVISYSDAVRLLGGGERQFITALDTITKGLFFGLGVPLPGVLGWLEARGEFVQVCRRLVARASDERDGLSRPDRLLAAHTVLVVTAYFEAFDTAPLPLTVTELDLDRAGQLGLAGSTPAAEAERFAATVLRATETMPVPHGSHEDFESELRAYYRGLSTRLRRLIEGLAVGDRLTGSDLRPLVDDLPARAVSGYTALLVALAGDFPEVAQWLNLREHRATRTTLHDLERRPIDEQRAALSRANQAHLRRPLIGPGELPVGIRVPVLADAYVAPPFRTGGVRADVTAGHEEFWAGTDVDDDIDGFLRRHVASERALTAPLLVLGQPGAGKSVLCRIYAARLATAGYLPVLVRLRSVAAVASVQDQIEESVRTTTGRRVDWTRLAASDSGTVSVILLDGFDELLQATGVSQSDYLLKVVDFQQRERDNGRPVAVIVTSRTSVADRARIPPETVLVRLESFDHERIESWLAIWNDHNAGYFAENDLRPLPVGTVACFPELAGLPLLLLMLALYDADANALQELADDDHALSRGELYERLLYRFVVRETEKHRPGQSEDALRRDVNVELRQLSVAAFGMLNRAQQWITTAELDDDLTVILGQSRPTVTVDMRSNLKSADLLIGRFFFIHHAQATRDDGVESTYEFLHSTFGEYLVARFSWQILLDTAARNAASTMPFSPADHGLLYALFSFAALSVRTATLRFLVGFADGLDPQRRADLTRVLHQLLTDAHLADPGPRFNTYEPRTSTGANRQAAYTANLVLLIVVTSRSVLTSELFPQAPESRFAWRSATLLWRSQLTIDEWDSIMAALHVERVWRDQPDTQAPRRTRDIRITVNDGALPIPAPDAFWTWSESTQSEAFTNLHTMEYVRRRTHFHCGGNDDTVLHAVWPMLDTVLAITASTFVGWFRADRPSAYQVLMDAVLLPVRTVEPAERRRVYERCAEVACYDFPSWSDATQIAYTTMLVNALSVDQAASPGLVADILRTLIDRVPHDTRPVAPAVVRCCAAAASREVTDPAAERAAEALRRIADNHGSSLPPVPAQQGREPNPFTDAAQSSMDTP